MQLVLIVMVRFGFKTILHLAIFLPKRQAILDNIERNGGVIVGKGKGKFVGGVEIPKGTRIDVIKVRVTVLTRVADVLK